MKKVYVIAHTHWDLEWYFTRQHARVQFAYHMDEVLQALATNKIDYYLVDGQMSILDDYLQTAPEKRSLITRFVQAGRLFIGPWYTQIDEMVTSGEAIVRNLQLGHQVAQGLGGEMPVGYLPDSFGQGQDMPKIYNGFDITKAVFWRGMPKEKSARYFYWTSDDDSQVLVANLRNGYPVGTELIESDDYAALLHKISSDTDSNDLVLPVGGDQRPVDFNLKARIAAANQAVPEYHLAESTYPEFFAQLQKNKDLPHYQGEFVDASTSKIHRGIYSSRADLKQIYDQLERCLTDTIEPLMAIAQYHGVPAKPGIMADLWKTVARGQAHDSSGGSNSDETNDDIRQRGVVALQSADALKAYLLRKLSSHVAAPMDLFFWNPAPTTAKRIFTAIVATRQPSFILQNAAGETVPFEVTHQEKVDMAVIRHDPQTMTPNIFYNTTVAIPLTIPATDWLGLQVEEQNTAPALRPVQSTIENTFYQLSFTDHTLTLTDKRTGQVYPNFITVEDGGDEGDTYDYSPAYHDWVLSLGFDQAAVKGQQGTYQSHLCLTGHWLVPADLQARTEHHAQTAIPYSVTFTLQADDPTIGFTAALDNTAKDHRMRLVLHTDVAASDSFADTPFGMIRRPVVDPHLKDWQAIGYKEEPTTLRPMIHLANTHDDQHSWTFLGLGEKDFQIIGEHFNDLAITLFRGVGYLGRPDLKRRPGDASGLQTKYVPTPDSQLLGHRVFKGGICLDPTFSPAVLQARHHQLAQGSLYFQQQTLDRFTSPIQYFPINENPQALAHHPLLDLHGPGVVVSSLTATQDGTGLVLRLYNPTKTTIAAPGTLDLMQNSNICALNLNDRVRSVLASTTKSLTLAAMRPGEIRSYGIYPIQ